MRARLLLLVVLFAACDLDGAPRRRGADLSLSPVGDGTGQIQPDAGLASWQDGANVLADSAGLVPDSAPQGTCPTAGSGGAKQDLTAQSFKASSGLQSKYHLYAAGLDWTRPVGLAVILHGDGGGFYTNPSWGADEMVKLLRAENLLTINALTPDSSTDTWWKDGDNNDEYLAELIDTEVLKRYPIERDRVLLIGYSGGAEFLTIYFVPNHGEAFCGGGAILFGCGTPPWKPVQFSETFKKSFKLHFYAGQNDQYLSNAQKGSTYYAGLGFTVTTDFPAGVSHNSIPFGTVLQGQLAAGILDH